MGAYHVGPSVEKTRTFKTERPNLCCNQFPQGRSQMIERFGKFDRKQGEGCHILICCVDSIAYEVEMRECCISLAPAQCFTKDNVNITVDGCLFFKCVDEHKACQDVSEAVIAITQFATSAMRTACGKMELNHVFENREAISAKVVSDMAESQGKWGIVILRFEVTEMQPSDRHVASALHKQAVSAREKIQTELFAEAKKRQVEIMSDAQKYKTEKEAEAYLYRNEKEGQGDKEKVMRVAKAEQESITSINSVMGSELGSSVVKMRMTQDFLTQFGKFAKRDNVIVLTNDITDINKICSTADSIFN